MLFSLRKHSAEAVSSGFFFIGGGKALCTVVLCTRMSAVMDVPTKTLTSSSLCFRCSCGTTAKHYFARAATAG